MALSLVGKKQFIWVSRFGTDVSTQPSIGLECDVIITCSLFISQEGMCFGRHVFYE